MVREVENPPAIQEGEQPRTLEQLAVEINYIKRDTCVNYWEMGRRLKEAKAQLPHGEWGKWLAEAVDFSQDSASRLMAIADAFPNSAALRNLNYTKVWLMATASPSIREEVMTQPQLVDGQEKRVEDMTTRQLEQLLREKKAAEKEAQEERALRVKAQNKAAMLSAQVEAAKKEASLAREEGRQQERARKAAVGDSQVEEKVLRREVQGLKTHLEGSGPTIVDALRGLGSQEAASLAFSLADGLEEWGGRIRQAAVTARNSALLEEEPEDLEW